MHYYRLLNNTVTAHLTHYQDYKEVIFTGVAGYGHKVSIKVSPDVVLTVAKLELLLQAVAKQAA